MAKIPRVFQKVFGSNAPGSGDGTIGIFGSFAAGNPLASTDLTVIQSLQAWFDGWLHAIIGQNGPPIEDMNALFYVITTQLSYIFQAGISEWNSLTTYYIGSLVNASGVIYTSLTDGNINNAVTDVANWAPGLGSVLSKSSAYGIKVTDDMIVADATSASFALTLPLASAAPGKEFKIKQINSGAHTVTLQTSGSDTIDGAATVVLTPDGVTMASITVKSTGTTWYII